MKMLTFTLILCLAAVGYAQQYKYLQLNRDIIEARLTSAPAKNKDRKERLEAMFRESGCKDDRLIEQKVNGSALPNVLCNLTGSSDEKIIVGAHYDNEGSGAGIVDNWSGASISKKICQRSRE